MMKNDLGLVRVGAVTPALKVADPSANADNIIAIIRKAAEEGNCVFVGRCADYILRDFDHVVNIFITANLEERIGRVAERHQCDRDAALKILNHKESSRSSYYNYYTGKKWGYSDGYDLCVNTSLLGLEATEQFIADFIRKRLKIGE